MEAFDFLGNKLELNDKVVFMRKNYRTLMVGTIMSLSNKTALIKHDGINAWDTETRQFYDQIIKIK